MASHQALPLFLVIRGHPSARGARGGWKHGRVAGPRVCNRKVTGALRKQEADSGRPPPHPTPVPWYLDGRTHGRAELTFLLVLSTRQKDLRSEPESVFVFFPPLGKLLSQKGRAQSL